MITRTSIPVSKLFAVLKLDAAKDDRFLQEILSALGQVAEKRGLDLALADGDSCAKNAVFVAIGGDGTMLEAMRLSAKHSGYAVGLHSGRLGFLADINVKESLPAAMDRLAALVSGLQSGLDDDLKLDRRLVLSAEVADAKMGPVVNEVYITVDTDSRMHQHPLRYEVWVDDEFVAAQLATGILISSPTGSTAYAMSAGGAILTPSSNSMEIIPMAAHTLTSRPVIVDATSKVEIRPAYDDRVGRIGVYLDGRKSLELSGEKPKVVVTKFGSPATILRSRSYSFFETLKHKLNWG